MVDSLPRIRKFTDPTAFHLLVLALIRPEPVQNSGYGIRRDCPRQPITHRRRPSPSSDPANRAAGQRLYRLVPVLFTGKILDEHLARANRQQIGSLAMRSHGASTTAEHQLRFVQSCPKIRLRSVWGTTLSAPLF